MILEHKKNEVSHSASTIASFSASTEALSSASTAHSSKHAFAGKSVFQYSDTSCSLITVKFHCG